MPKEYIPMIIPKKVTPFMCKHSHFPELSFSFTQGFGYIKKILTINSNFASKNHIIIKIYM